MSLVIGSMNPLGRKQRQAGRVLKLGTIYTGQVEFRIYTGKGEFRIYTGKVEFRIYTGKVEFRIYTGKV